MVGAVALFSRSEQVAFTNNAVFSDFTYPSLYRKFTFLTCKSDFNVPSLRKNTLHPQSPGDKLTSRTIAYGKSHKKKDADTLSSHNIIENSELIFSEKDANMDLSNASSLVLSQIDIQPSTLEHGNQENLLDKLNAIQLHILAMEQWNTSRLKACHKNYSLDATNLIHYLALKTLSIEQIKGELYSIGLLNLETVNAHILSSLSACIKMLTISRSDVDKALPSNKSLGYQMKKLDMDVMLKSATFNRDLLLGNLQDQRTTHIMVTIGQEALENDTHISQLIESGTSIFRINCAHGNPDMWNEIITRVRKISQLLEKPCRIIMDLAGPKLRTGTLKSGPCVIKISPKRDAVGNVIRSAHVWLSHKGAGPPPPHVSPDVTLHIDSQDFLSELKLNDLLRFTDAHGNKRYLRILNKYSIFSGVGYIAECRNTSYVESGTALSVKAKKRKSYTGFVIDVPPIEQFLRLRVGDLLTISRDSSDEHNKPTSTTGANRITCPSGYLFDSVKPGDPIAFDDGKIWGVIKGTSMSEVVVSITHAGLKGTKLGSEKSINIPKSDIRYEGLTSKDLMDLEFVAANADMVGISFVRNVSDIVVLRQELKKRKLSKLGVALKIETQGGFEKLPLLILEAMKSPNPLGVMIARGDLAVECGWEKLADIQDQIFAICSAAHVPVILATQVLESLIKTGVPTRAEITDAANGRRACCVMLNKGKNVVKAVSTLDTILNRQNIIGKTELKPLMLSSQVD